jgi:deoxyribonuclease-1
MHGIRMPIFVFFLATMARPVAAQNTRIDSFEAAKKLAPQIYADHPEECYCGCRYSGNEVDLASCGYEPKRNACHKPLVGTRGAG